MTGVPEASCITQLQATDVATATIELSDQHLDMPDLRGGWIISA